jgi:hypothetical protein
MRRLAQILLVAAVLYAALCAAAYEVMRQPPERFGAIMKHVPGVAFFVLPFQSLWFRARAGVLHVGDPAPGFALPTQDRQQTVQLASFRGSQPVVLVFGSYT